MIAYALLGSIAYALLGSFAFALLGSFAYALLALWPRSAFDFARGVGDGPLLIHDKDRSRIAY
jgi:hypothetical protein